MMMSIVEARKMVVGQKGRGRGGGATSHLGEMMSAVEARKRAVSTLWTLSMLCRSACCSSSAARRVAAALRGGEWGAGGGDDGG